MEALFQKYVSRYNLQNPDIALKYHHSLRVMKLCEKYALQFGFTKEEVKLAMTIGLLHDLGRFEQLKVYHTYDDHKSIDHADYSIEQLFDKGLITYFVPNVRKYDKVIELAIKNHNKKEICGVTDPFILKFCYFIRDMDKLDVYYNMAILGEILLNTEDVPISKKVMAAIRNHETVNTKDRENQNDRIVTMLAFVFDIHYDLLIPKIKEYIDLIYQKLENKKYFEEVYTILDQYIEERI